MPPRIRTERRLRRGEEPAIMPNPRDHSQQDIATYFAAELRDYMDVLVGRVAAPYDLGSSTLMEVADGYFARASEIEQFILGHERTGAVNRGDQLYKFRTGELRSFLDVAKRAAELGSRRITVDQMQRQAEDRGIDTPRRGRSTGES